MKVKSEVFAWGPWTSLHGCPARYAFKFKVGKPWLWFRAYVIDYRITVIRTGLGQMVYRRAGKGGGAFADDLGERESCPHLGPGNHAGVVFGPYRGREALDGAFSVVPVRLVTHAPPLISAPAAGLSRPYVNCYRQ